MKKHTFQENYEKIFGSIEEGWWDDMDSASQAQYIKDHPGSKQAQQADDDGGDDEPKVPAPDSKSDKGKPRVSANPYDDNYGQEVDDEDDYDMGVVPGSREEWEDIEPGDPEMRSGDESAEELGDLMKQQQNHIEDMFEKGADREDIEAAEGNLEDLEREYDEKVESGEGEDDEDDGGKKEEPSDDEPKGEPSAWSQKAQKAKDDLDDLNKWGAPPDEIGDWIEDNKWSLSGGKLGRAADLEFAPVQKAFDELEDAYIAAEEEDDWDAYDKAKEDLTKLVDKKLDSQKVSRSRRTGKELDQETLTIDGKQYRRISEGVEKESKPKYTFSEFYQRFKR